MDLLTFTQLGTGGNRALPLIHTLYSSELHTHWVSQSSVVASWQRIYNSLCHFKSHKESSFCSLILSCHYSETANSEGSARLNSSVPKLTFQQAGVPKLDSSLHFTSCWRTLLHKHFARTTQKKTVSIAKKAYLLICCLAMDILLSRFRGIMFTESFPSNVYARHNIYVHYWKFAWTPYCK
jgi:hypothetical protein